MKVQYIRGNVNENLYKPITGSISYRKGRVSFFALKKFVNNY